jgi:RHS repeat-associated protein
LASPPTGQAQVITPDVHTQAASASGNAGAGESQDDLVNPVTTKLTVEVEAYAQGQFWVKLGDQEIPFTGAGCGVPATPAPVEFTNLKTHTPLVLAVRGNQVSSIKLSFIPDIDVELVKKKGVKANLKTFKIYVDGEEQAELLDYAPNYCAAYLATWKLELRPDRGIREARESDLPWSRAEENLGEEAAPGDAAWPELGPGKSTNSAVMALKWGVNLGHLLTGREAGQIRLRETNLTARTFSPISLLFTPTSPNANELFFFTNKYTITNYVGGSAVVITNGILRQAKTALALADVTTNSAWEYAIKFYHTNWITAQSTNLTNYGFCSLASNATPFVAYTLSSPNQTTNWLRIVESRNNSNYVSELRYDGGTRLWSLTHGFGSDYVVMTRSNTINAAASNRVEVVEFKDAAGQLAFRSAEKYQEYKWGWELVTVTNNLGGSQLVTQYEFYTNTLSLTDVGKLKSIIHPDGSWEFREYFPLLDEYGSPYLTAGMLWHVYRPWKSSPSLPSQANLTNSWVSEYSYDWTERSLYVPALTHRYDPEDLATKLGGTVLEIFTRAEGFDEGLNYSSAGEHRTESVERGSYSGYGDVSSTSTYTLLAGPDYGDQPVFEEYTNGVKKAFFYNWGLWTNNVFNPLSTNLVHWRMSAVTGGDPWIYAPGAGPGVAAGTFQGQEIDYTYVVPRQSTVDTKIMQDSKVVARETWVVSSYAVSSNDFTTALLHQYLQSHDALGHVTNIVRRDPFTGSQRTIYSAGWKDANGQDGNLKRWEIDEDGVQTEFTYDGLKRVKTATKKGVSLAGYPTQGDIVTSFTYDAYGRTRSQIQSGGGLSLTNLWVFDNAGRLTSFTETNGLVTAKAYTANGLIETVTLPGNVTRITEKFLDGRLNSITGSAVVTNFFDYLVNTNNPGQYYAYSPRTLITTSLGASGSARWTRKVTDMRDMPVEEHRRGMFGTITNMYLHDYRGLPCGVAQPPPNGLWAGWTGNPAPPTDSVVHRLYFEPSGPIMGNTNFTFFDIEHTPVPNLNGARELVENRSWYALEGSYWHRVSTNLVYLTDASTNGTIHSIFKERLTGLDATTKYVTTAIDADTNSTVTTVTIDRPNKKLTTVTVVPQSQLAATNVMLNALVVAESTPTVSTPTYYHYDGLAREVRVQDPLGFNSYTEFSPATGQVLSVTNATYTNFNRAGLPRMMQDASGLHVYKYDHASRQVSDTGSSGFFNGLTVSNRFHAVYGKSRASLHGASTAIQHDYGYDSYGRLGSVTNGLYTAAYGYLPNSDLLQTTTSRNNGTAVLTATRAWDFGYRLRSIQNVVGSTPITGHAYAYDSINRRIQATLVDGSAWAYDYDDRNEVIAGRHVWDDFSPVAGQSFQYAYDPIGNRSTSAFGGDQNGGNLRPVGYQVNALNQYTQRTNTGYFEVLGVATATAGVTVSNLPAYERGEYYWKELQANNASGPQYPSVTVTATGGGTSNLTGSVFVPRATETLGYDLDGNLTSDSRWNYTWDAENRLTQMVANTAIGPQQLIRFEYDGLGRRTRKVVWNNTGGTGAPLADRKLVYDGWNLIAELNATNNTVLRSFAWGQDLSGSLDGAGGVGGLLMVFDHAGNACHFAAFDGNGNVTALVNGDQTLSAQYEYGPFGEPLRVTGAFARTNPFRWSTKFTDDETDLVYYGRRYYSAVLGKWMSRDPIEEKGGINLYGFIANNAVSGIDPLGEFSFIELLGDLAMEYGDKGAEAAKGLSFVQRVRQVVEVLNGIQQFSAGMQAASDALGVDGTDMLLRLKEWEAGEAQGLRGTKSLMRAEAATDRHHIFPQEFRKKFRSFVKGSKTGKFDIDAFGVYMNERMHRYGLHGKGKNFNELWRRQLRGKKDAMFLIGFGFGLMNEMGFDDYLLIGM